MVTKSVNKENLALYISNPEGMIGKDNDFFYTLFELYPYFQTSYLLYCKKLHLENDINYNKYLKIAAIYAGDRKVLFNHIHKPKKNQQAITEIATNASVNTDISHTPVPLESTNKQPENQAKESTEISTDLEKNILSEAINSSIQIEVEKIITSTEDPIKENEENKTKTADNEFDLAKEYSFSDWLKITNPHKANALKTLVKLDSETKSKQDIIYKFILEEPKISKPQKEFFSPVNWARKSVTDSNEIISETLAQIYEKQGNFAKAIELYQALNLKYPEKSRFFASRIKELKKRLIE